MDFWFVYWLVVGALVSIGLVVAHYDRVIVFLMRRMNMHVFPTAIRIAMLITEHPEQWTASPHRLLHPQIGSIWTANGAYGLYLETEFGKWEPNKIERRIIREAVDWRISQYIRNRLEAVARQQALR